MQIKLTGLKKKEIEKLKEKMNTKSEDYIHRYDMKK